MESAAGGVRQRRRALLAAPLLLAGLVMLTAPAGATAAIQPCSPIYNLKPLQRVAPGPPPLVIGDSITGFAMDEIRRAGFRINAQGCRSFKRGVDVIARLRERRGGSLPRLVVLQVGTAGRVNMKQIQRARRLLGNGRRLGLVTPRKFGTGRGRGAAKTMRQAAQRMRGVVLFDWVRFSRGRDEWFHPDLTHPNDQNAQALADFLGGVAFGSG